MSSWQKTGISGHTIRRTDGAYVHRFAGDEWIAYPAAGGPALKQGERLRKFLGSAAAIAAIDALPA